MKIAIRYQSRGGNTKTVAEAIGKIAGVRAQAIDVPLEEPVDLLYVGGGVYKWDIDPDLKAYLRTLDSNLVKSIAAFSTAGGMDGARKIGALAKEKGICVCEKTLPVKVFLTNHAAFGSKGYFDLSEKQLHAVGEFVKNTAGQ